MTARKRTPPIHRPPGAKRAASAPAPRLALAALALLVAFAPARALRAPLPQEIENRRLPSSSTSERLAAPDVLSPFSLSISAHAGDLREVLEAGRRQFIEAGPDRYLHVALTPPRGADARSISAPSGLRVVDADLYFADGETLKEASLLLRTTRGRKNAIEQLVAHLGSPEFEAVLPGNLDLALGWRTPRGYLVASFTDLPIVHVSAFSNDPTDLMAGSSIVLFEGLSAYADRLHAGAPRGQVESELREILDWYDVAREVLRPAR
jgi:hypothetical protein